MDTLKNDKVPLDNQINIEFDEPSMYLNFKGKPNDVGLLITANNNDIYNAIIEYLNSPYFSENKGDFRLIFGNLHIIPNSKNNSVDFLSLSESLPSDFTSGFKVFSSSGVDALILYSIFTAEANFSIKNFRELVGKFTNSSFLINTIEKFLYITN